METSHPKLISPITSSDCQILIPKHLCYSPNNLQSQFAECDRHLHRAETSDLRDVSVTLGKWFSGGLSSAGSMVGLNELENFFPAQVIL